MKRYRALLVPAVAYLLVGVTGCANFEAAKEFAKQGDGIATAVNGEFAFLAKRCTDNVRLYQSLLPDTKANSSLQKACEAQNDALGELAANTLDLFSKYNKALEAIAEDKNYDLSASFKSTADRLKALKEKSGPVIKGEDVDVSLKAANLFSDVILRVVRARELKQLVTAGDTNWSAVMSPLKTYFGPHPGNRTVNPSPYENSILASKAPLDAASELVQPLLKGDGPGCVVPPNQSGPVEIRCETMWARQMNYELTQQLEVFDGRLPQKERPAEPAATVKRIHEAIDAWLAAHSVLREEISRPSASQVWGALQQLKDRVDELDEALKSRK